jgi:Transketolase, thiamine diphosphate binding domain
MEMAPMSVPTLSSAPSVGRDIVLTSINTIRTLSMDGVQAVNSGHPGTPMALGPPGRIQRRFPAAGDDRRFAVCADTLAGRRRSDRGGTWMVEATVSDHLKT